MERLILSPRNAAYLALCRSGRLPLYQDWLPSAAAELERLGLVRIERYEGRQDKTIRSGKLFDVIAKDGT